MRLALTLAQTLESLALTQNLASLLRQRGIGLCHLALSRHTNPHHLLGFLSRRCAAQGWQTQGDARGILSLAHAMAFGHPKERFNGIGAHRQADWVES